LITFAIPPIRMLLDRTNQSIDVGVSLMIWEIYSEFRIENGHVRIFGAARAPLIKPG
jgi:hypothetical protein